MTPTQKIKHLIIIRQCEWDSIPVPEVNADTIDKIFESFPCLQDASNDVRCGSTRTNISDGNTPWCRGLSYYESYEVADQMPDGSWVGWTYWYGGGKHSDPSSIAWMDYAYDISCKEYEVVVVKQEFTKT